MSSISLKFNRLKASKRTQASFGATMNMKQSQVIPVVYLKWPTVQKLGEIKSFHLIEVQSWMTLTLDTFKMTSCHRKIMKLDELRLRLLDFALQMVSCIEDFSRDPISYTSPMLRSNMSWPNFMKGNLAITQEPKFGTSCTYLQVLLANNASRLY